MSEATFSGEPGEPEYDEAETADTACLVALAQTGDREAFSRLYTRYFDRVYGYVRVVVRDRHEAEDLTQEVFTRALQALPDFEPDRPFLAWLFRVARNAAIDLLRRQQHIEVTEPAELDSKREAAAAPAPPSDLEAVLAWLSDKDVAFFVGRLPLAQRQVLTLRFLLDLSTPEIAEMIGRSEKAVRQLQSRALVTLHERLIAIGRKDLTDSEGGLERTPTVTRLKPMPVIVRRRFSVRDKGRNNFRDR
jgi:RNA polymerase sigma-70 factor, ECF subfamily